MKRTGIGARAALAKRRRSRRAGDVVGHPRPGGDGRSRPCRRSARATWRGSGRASRRSCRAGARRHHRGRSIEPRRRKASIASGRTTPHSRASRASRSARRAGLTRRPWSLAGSRATGRGRAGRSMGGGRAGVGAGRTGRAVRARAGGAVIVAGAERGSPGRGSLPTRRVLRHSRPGCEETMTSMAQDGRNRWGRHRRCGRPTGTPA